MQRHRFHASLEQFAGSAVTLTADEAHHLTRVLRLGEGARVCVFDGAGGEWECEVARVAKHEVELRMGEALPGIVESPLAITLLQGLARGEKMDWIVQKATELGVARLVPIATQRSVVQLDGERADKRSSH